MDGPARRSRLDRTGVKLAVFALILAAAFGGGAALGATVGPEPSEPAMPAEQQPAPPTTATAHESHQ